MDTALGCSLGLLSSQSNTCSLPPLLLPEHPSPVGLGGGRIPLHMLQRALLPAHCLMTAVRELTVTGGRLSPSLSAPFDALSPHAALELV